MRTFAILFTVALLFSPASGFADYSDGLHSYLKGQYSKAMQEFRPLAGDGDPQAQYVLGSMYANGKGILQDFVQAHAWLNLAASQGHEKAALYRDEIAEKMTTSQVARAQQLASQRQTRPAKQEKEKVNKEVVVSIQKHLEDLGYYSGAVDGLMGPNTEQSIRRYQSDYGLEESGRPSQALLERIRETAGKQADQKAKEQAPQNEWPHVLLHEEFVDGNYDRNPGWTVASGTFWVDSNSFLRTEQRIPASSGQGRSSEAKPQDLFGQVVKDILLPKQESAESDRSEIFTPLQIGKAFALKVDLQVLSEQPGQSFELGLYQSQDRSTGYALRYVLQQDQSLALIRTSRSGSSVIDAVKGKKLLRKGRHQSLAVFRHADGRMKVVTGEDEVLSTRDTLLESFNGFTFVNRGGDYAISRVRIQGASD